MIRWMLVRPEAEFSPAFSRGGKLAPGRNWLRKATGATSNRHYLRAPAIRCPSSSYPARYTQILPTRPKEGPPPHLRTCERDGSPLHRRRTDAFARLGVVENSIPYDLWLLVSHRGPRLPRPASVHFHSHRPTEEGKDQNEEGPALQHYLVSDLMWALAQLFEAHPRRREALMPSIAVCSSRVYTRRSQYQQYYIVKDSARCHG